MNFRFNTKKKMANLVAYIIPVLVVLVVLKILSLPLKLIKTIIINAIVGGIILFVLAYFGIVVNLAWWGYVLTGLLGVPGLVIAIILTAIL